MADLERFTRAQHGVYQQALAEVRAGRKDSHWMWFIFPQLAGLGRSATAQRYAVADLDEAGEYLADPVLGQRLVEITTALLAQPNRDPGQVFGYPDDLKLCGSMTLFAQVPGANPVFAQVIAEFFGGRPDQATLSLLGQSSAE